MNDDLKFQPIEDGAKTLDDWFGQSGYFSTPSTSEDGRMGIYTEQQKQTLLNRPTRALYDEMLRKLPKGMTHVALDKDNNQLIVVVSPNSDFKFQNGQIVRKDNSAFARGSKPAVLKLDIESGIDKGTLIGKGKNNGFQMVVDSGGSTRLLSNIDAVLLEVGQELTKHAKRDLETINRAFNNATSKFNQSYAGGQESLKDLINEQRQANARMPQTQLVLNAIKSTSVGAGQYASAIKDMYLHKITGRLGGDAIVAIESALVAREEAQARAIIENFVNENMRHRMSKKETDDLVERILQDRKYASGLTQRHHGDDAFGTGRIGVSSAAANALSSGDSPTREQWLRDMLRSAWSKNGRQQVLHRGLYASSALEKSLGIQRGQTSSKTRFGAAFDAVMPVLHTFNDSLEGQKLLKDIFYVTSGGAYALGSVRSTKLEVKATEDAIKKAQEKIRHKAAMDAWIAQGGKRKDPAVADFIKEFEEKHDLDEYTDLAVQKLLLSARQVRDRGAASFLNLGEATAAKNWDQSAQKITFLAQEAVEAGSGTKASDIVIKQSIQRADTMIKSILRSLGLGDEYASGISIVSGLDNERKGMRTLEDMIGGMIGEYISDIGVNRVIGASGDKLRGLGYDKLKSRLEKIRAQHNGDKDVETAINLLLNGDLIDFSGQTYKANNLVSVLSQYGNGEEAGRIVSALAYVADIAMRAEGSDAGRLFKRDSTTGELTLQKNGFYRSFSTVHQNNEYPAVHGSDLARAIKAIAADLEYVSDGKRENVAKAIYEVVRQNGPTEENKQILAAEQAQVQAAIDATINGGKGIASGTAILNVKALGDGRIQVGDTVYDPSQYEQPLYDALDGGVSNFEKTLVGHIYGKMKDVALGIIQETLGDKNIDDFIAEGLEKEGKKVNAETKEEYKKKLVSDLIKSGKIMVAYDWRTQQDREAGNMVLVGKDAEHGVYVDRGYLPGSLFEEENFSSNAISTFLSTTNPNDTYAYERARYDLYRDLRNDWFYEHGVRYEQLMDAKTEDAKVLKLLGMDPDLYQAYEMFADKSVDDLNIKNDASKILRGYASVHGAIGHKQMFDDLIRDVKTKDIIRALNVIYPGKFNEKDRKGAVEALRSVFTIGSKGSKDLLKKAASLINPEKGITNIYDALGELLTGKELGILNLLGFRAPYSHGINDSNYLSFFMDEEYNKPGGAFGSPEDAGAIMISLASQLAMGADWDGDTGVFLGSGNDPYRREVFNVGNDVQKRLREWRAAFVWGSQKADNSTWATNKMGQLVNTALFSDASRAQRVSKLKTGMLANLRGNMQAFINGRLNNREAIDPSFIVSHMFFEGLAQDAISSKKIIENLMNLRVNDRGELERLGNEKLSDDQTELTDDQLAAYETGLSAINTVVGKIFSNNGTLQDVFNALQTVGLINEKNLFAPDKKEIFADTIFTLSRMALDKRNPERSQKAKEWLASMGIENPIVTRRDAVEFARSGPNGANMEVIQRALTESGIAMGIHGASDDPMALLRALAFHKYQPEKRALSIDEIIHGRDTSTVLSAQQSAADLSNAVLDISGKLQIIIGLLNQQNGLVGKMGGTKEDIEDAYRKYGGLESKSHAAHRIAQIVTGSTNDFTVRQGDVNRLAIARSVFDSLVGGGEDIKLNGKKIRFEDFSSLYNKKKLNKEEEDAITAITERLSASGANKEFIDKYLLSAKTASDIDDDLTVLRGTYVGFLDSTLEKLTEEMADSNTEPQFKAVREMYRAGLKMSGLDDKAVEERMNNALEMAKKQRWLRETYVGETKLKEVPLAGGLRGGISTADFLTRNKDTGAVGIYESKTGRTATILDSEKIQAQVYAALTNKLFTDIRTAFTDMSGTKKFYNEDGNPIDFNDRITMKDKDKKKLRDSVVEAWSKNKLFLEYFGGDQKQMEDLFDLLFSHNNAEKIVAHLGRVAENGDTSIWTGQAMTPQLMQKLIENPWSISAEERAFLLGGSTVVHKPSQDVYRSLIRGIAQYQKIQSQIEKYKGLDDADHPKVQQHLAALRGQLDQITYYNDQGVETPLIGENGRLPDAKGISGLSERQMEFIQNLITGTEADAALKAQEESDRLRNEAFKRNVQLVKNAIEDRKHMRKLGEKHPKYAETQEHLAKLGIVTADGKLSLSEDDAKILSEEQKTELQRMLSMDDLSAAEQAQYSATIESQRRFRDALKDVRSMADLQKNMRDLAVRFDEKGNPIFAEGDVGVANKELYGRYAEEYNLLDKSVSDAMASMSDEQKKEIQRIQGLQDAEAKAKAADEAHRQTEQSKADAERLYLDQLHEEKSLLDDIYRIKSAIAQIDLVKPAEGSSLAQQRDALQTLLDEREKKLGEMRSDESRARVESDLTEQQISRLGGDKSEGYARVTNRQNSILADQLSRETKGMLPPRQSEEKPAMFSPKWWANDFLNGPKFAFSMLFRGGVTSRIIFSFISSIKRVIQLTEQLNTSMTNLRIITGKNAEEANSMMKNYNGLADELGVTTAAIAQIGAEWLRQGYNVQETENLIVASTKLAKLGFMDQGAAVKSLTAAMKGFNLSATESMSIVDKLTTLDAKYATTAGDIATAMTRVASVANNAGMSLDETAAAITAIIDTTQQDAGTVGNALKTMLSRYGNVKAGSFAALEGSEDGDSENINDVERVLGALGIQIRTSKMEMRDFADVLDDIAEKWTTLTTVEQNAIAVALGGVRQRNTTVALLNSYQTYKKALEDEENSAGRADRKYEVYKDSIEFQKQQLQAAWEGLVLKIDQSPVMKGVLFSLTNIVKYADRWVPVLISAIPLLRTLVNSRLTAHKQAINDNTDAVNRNTDALPQGSPSGGTPGYWGTRVKYAHGKQKGEDSAYTRGQIAGITIGSVVSSGMSYGASGGGLFGNMIDENAGTSEFENGADSVISGVTGAAGAGIGAVIGTMIAPGIGTALGATLGPILLDPLASLFKWLRHRDEIEMSQRVEEAKKRLKAIQEVSSSITSLQESVESNSSTWSPSNWKKNQEDYEAMVNAFAGSYAMQKAYKEVFDENYVEGIINSLDTISSDEMAKLLAAQIIAQGREAYAASEEEISNLSTEYVETKFKLEKESDEEERKKLRAQLSSIEVDLQKYTDALNQSYLVAATMTSGVYTMSQGALSTATLERVIRQIAKEWSKNNPDIFYGGKLTSSARQDIIEYLRGEDRYASLFRNKSQTFSNKLRSKMVAEDLYGDQLDEIKDLLDTEGGYDKVREKFSDSQIDLIYKADAGGIERIAHALNMTAEQAIKAEKSIGWVTDETIANGIDGLADSFDKLGGVLTDIAKSSTISSKTMSEIMSNYSFLLEGEDGSISSKNILDNLVGFFTDGSVGGLVGLAASSALTSTSMWEQFKNQYSKDNKYSKIGINAEQWKKIEESSNLESVADVMLGIPEAMNAYAEMAADLTGSLKIADYLKDLLTEYETNVYDNEIANLQSIKDSLDDVNKQREKELELIKAKMNLENAQKEKKRVYREGVGFVFMSDQNAIKEAADSLDKLEREKNQSDIQYQIDMLEQQKEILVNLERNEQLENIQNMLKAYLNDDKFGSIVTHIQSLDDESIAKQVRDGMIESLYGNTGTVREAKAKNADEEYNKLLSDFDESNDSSWVKKGIQEFGGQSISSVLTNRSNPYYQRAKTMYEDHARELSVAAETLSQYEGVQYTDEGGERRTAGEKLEDSKQYTNKDLATPNTTLYYGVTYRPFDSSNPDWWGMHTPSMEKDHVYYLGLNYAPKEGVLDAPQYLFDHVKAYAAIGQNGAFTDLEEISASDVGSRAGVYITNDGSTEKGWYYDGDKYYPLRLNDGDLELSDYWSDTNWWYEMPQNALGSLSFPGGSSLINERGLEGIITPEGTITSLPAKSGIIPADLTKNLWALGEVAPNLITQLSGKSFNRIDEKKSEDNSMHVGTLNATFNTDAGFDAAAFWNSVKSQISLTKNNH